jgi:hypothetical protein
VHEGEGQFLEPFVILGNERHVDLKGLVHRAIGHAVGNAITVGFVRDLLPALGQIVLTIGIVAMGQQFRTLPHPVGAAA